MAHGSGRTGAGEDAARRTQRCHLRQDEFVEPVLRCRGGHVCLKDLHHLQSPKCRGFISDSNSVPRLVLLPQKGVVKMIISTLSSRQVGATMGLNWPVRSIKMLCTSGRHVCVLLLLVLQHLAA